MQQIKPPALIATTATQLPLTLNSTAIQFHAVEGIEIKYNRNRELINLMLLL